MRVFIALNFSPELRDRLSFFNGVKAEGIKWVEPENLHLTLFFMGDVVSDENLDVLKAAMSCLGSLPSFEISFSETGAFPGFEKPRVLWAGVERGRKELSRMYFVLRKKMSADGFITENRFSPHVTLGRVKKKPDDAFIRRFRNHNFAGGSVERIEKVDIMESVLTQTGPEYRILHSERLLS